MKSMHENVPDWCDCCTCEPEPRWQQLEEELQREREAREAKELRDREKKNGPDSQLNGLPFP